VVALCDFSPEKLAAAQEKHPHMKLTSHADDLLHDPEIDLVSIASFDDHHFAQTLKALQAGKHVFVEKPLCRSLTELRLLKKALAQHSHLRLTSNLVLRAAPVYNWLRRMIHEGAFGEIYAFDGDYLYGRLHKITEGWRKDVPDYSVLLGGGIHLIDLMLWLTGQTPQKVTAVGNRLSSAATGFRYDDFVAATFQFPSGLIGRITANFGCVHRHQHVVRVFGTKGTFLYDDQGPRGHFSRDPAVAPEALDLSPLPDTKGALIPVFVQNILSRQDLGRQMQHEFDVISVCLAADRALASAGATEVEYV
jgi:predicted dehydrogenase